MMLRTLREEFAARTGRAEVNSKRQFPVTASSVKAGVAGEEYSASIAKIKVATLSD